MCGINGVYKFSGGESTSIIQRMNAKIHHRGPDGEGVYTNKKIAFGHKRLSILDISEASSQPFESADGRYSLIFNGEIYNYKALRSELRASYDFKTTGDTEVLLAAYIIYGKSCLKKLNGMFAFAVWDNNTETLFAARDRFGIKPFYYVHTEKFLLFSSSIEAILASGLVARKVNPHGVVDYLRYQTVHGPETIVKSVMSLLPGHLITANEERVEIEKYYDISTATKSFEGSSSEAQKMVKEEFQKAVERRMVSDVPFGAFLSGGIDSSLVVSQMTKFHASPVKTFSVSFLEDEFSEARYAKIIAEKYGTDHTEVKLSVQEFKKLIPEGLEKMDHPSGDGLNTYVVSKKTKENGVKMALSGLGGDELFGGYSVFKQIPELRAKKWLQSFPVFARKPLGNLYRNFKGTVEAAKIAEVLKLERFDTEHIYSFYRTLLFDYQIQNLLKTDEKLPPNKVFEITNRAIGYGTPGWSVSDLSKISIAEFKTYLTNVLLRDTDNMTMAHGLEVRVPFLDHELVEKVLGVGDTIKKPITPKQLLVNSFSDELPQEIYNRNKMGFVLPYELWMKSELKDICREGLNAFGALTFIEEKEVELLWKRFLTGHKFVTWSRVWALVTLGYWLKRNNVS